jgi:hypothetical protein
MKTTGSPEGFWAALRKGDLHVVFAYLDMNLHAI